MGSAQSYKVSPTSKFARAHLRYDGSHQPLEVAFGTQADMQAAFKASHQARFGFTTPKRAVEFEMISVEAIGATGEHAVTDFAKNTGKPPVVVPLFRTALRLS